VTVFRTAAAQPDWMLPVALETSVEAQIVREPYLAFMDYQYVYLLDLQTRELIWAGSHRNGELLGFSEDGTAFCYYTRNDLQDILVTVDIATGEGEAAALPVEDAFYYEGGSLLRNDQLYYVTAGYEETKLVCLDRNTQQYRSFPIDLPEADLILLSLDGDRQRHNTIRGNTYDTILENISKATADNICFYMAINQINKGCVDHVCRLARDTQNVRAVSFNFHTPYPDTKELALTKEDKANCCKTITQMMKEGCPVFNLKSAFPYLIENKFPTPCHQCLVIEDGKISTCGRCIEVPGLCEQCGYFFVAEYTLLFRGNLKVVFEMLKTYLKYI
jgi:hypothetical protein